MVEPKTELQMIYINEQKRKAAEMYQRASDIQWLDSRMADGRMSRMLACIKREEAMEKDYLERKDHAAIVNARAEKEAALAHQIQEQKRKEIAEIARRQLIRENDPSVRELKNKLNAAYVRRDLEQQIRDNEYKKIQQQINDHRNYAALKEFDKDFDAKEEAKIIAQKAQYKHEIQTQLANLQKVRQCKFEDEIIEKNMLADVMRTIYDEDMRVIEAKKKQGEILHQEMLATQHARSAWRLKQKELIIKEELNLEKQQLTVADRTSGILAAKAEKIRLKDELNQKISKELIEKEDALAARRDIIFQLVQQEAHETAEQNDLAEKRKLAMSKKDTMEALTKQMERNRLKIKNEIESDVKCRKKAEEIIEESERKEQEKQRNAREKKKKYAEELKMQMDLNKKKKEQDKEETRLRLKGLKDYDNSWLDEVKNERTKIIEEHVPHVLGYMQAGVLKKPDIPIVKAAVSKHEHLKHLDVEAMGKGTNKPKHPHCNAQCLVLKKY